MKPTNETALSMGSAAQEKAALRKAARAARDSMAEEDRRSKSERICLRLSEIYDGLSAEKGPSSPTVCVYKAFGSEVDVDRFALHVWNEGGSVAFPCMEERVDGGLAAGASSGIRPRARVEGQTERQAGRRALMTMRLVSREAYASHPEGGASAVPFLRAAMKTFSPEDEGVARFSAVPPESADMVVVPLVAFDDEGGRLGYGGGHYDEFLKRARPDATVVGVGFAEQRVGRVPREPHDIGIPLIVSA